ncbi:hypothetical protein L3Y34_013449 [Caenorhabditis briggsae]|uniref:Uncharacterized protein n=1 Tax=Caenorhabditis briggsae TaxID=6238 RepID=A0AAE9CWC1_CAEBR|nr:hypothetical protein L3Y34_013449 [Caenorhabditis briggsae]
MEHDFLPKQRPSRFDQMDLLPSYTQTPIIPSLSPPAILTSECDSASCAKSQEAIDVTVRNDGHQNLEQPLDLAMVEKLMNRKTIEWISDLQLKLPGGLLRTSQTNPKDILSPPDRPKCKLVALPPPAKRCEVLTEFISQILPDESHTIEPLATEKEIWDRVTERLVPGNFRAQHLIQDLLKPRPELCKKCSFKHNDPRYQKQETRDHIDQHTRDSLDEIPRFWWKDSKAVVKSQEWYPSEKDWLCAKKSKLMENTTIVHKDVPTAESTNKSCSICFEKFVEYYDDEDEVWRLRQSMEYKKGVVHTYCMEVDNKGVGTV